LDREINEIIHMMYIYHVYFRIMFNVFSFCFDTFFEPWKCEFVAIFHYFKTHGAISPIWCRWLSHLPFTQETRGRFQWIFKETENILNVHTSRVFSRGVHNNQCS